MVLTVERDVIDPAVRNLTARIGESLAEIDRNLEQIGWLEATIRVALDLDPAAAEFKRSQLQTLKTSLRQQRSAFLKQLDGVTSIMSPHLNRRGFNGSRYSSP